jgi:type VI protein secretion system component Hcp
MVVQFLACLFILTGASVALASPAVVLKVEGVEGASNQKGYRGWSDANSFSGNFSAGACGEIVVYKEFDMASVKFIEGAFNGQRYSSIMLANTSITKSGQAYESVRVTISNARIQKVEAVGEGPASSEKITIAGETIEFMYTEVDSDGNARGNVGTTIYCGSGGK